MHSEFQFITAGEPETHLPFSCDLSNGHSLPSSHCFHISGGREKWYSGPHSYARHSIKGRGKAKTETERQRETEIERAIDRESKKN